MSSKIIHLDAYALISLIILGMTNHAYAETASCRCVAFRLDDIQDYYLNKVQIEIINTFQKNDADLTVGVIGNYFGNDQSLVNVLKESVQKNNPKIEVANHGWNHEDFTKLSKDIQLQLLKRTNEKVFNVLGADTIGFIAPFNTINTDMSNTLKENGVRYVSANVTMDQPPYNIKANTLYHLPGTAFTGNLNKDNTFWFSTSHKETFAQVQSSLINYGFAVVMLHPQEYSVREGLNYKNEVDFNQIHELEMLIEQIKDNGLKIVTVKEIPDHTITNQKAPGWIKSIFAWYEIKKISTDEILNAIKFLTEKKIIRF